MARGSGMLVRREAGESAALLRREGDSRVSLRTPAPSADGVKSGAAALSRGGEPGAAAAGIGKAMRPRDKAAVRNALKRAGTACGAAGVAAAEVEGGGREEDGRALRYASRFAESRARGRDSRARAWKGAGRAAGAARGAMAFAGGGADAEDDARDLASSGLQAGLDAASRARGARLKSACRRAAARRRLAVAARRRLSEARAPQAAKGAVSRAAGAFKAAGAPAPSAALAPLVAAPLLVALALAVAVAVGAAMDDGDYDLSQLTPNERTVAKYLLGKGVPLKQTAAIMGNVYAESRFDPSARNPDGGAFGLIQWLGSRKDGLMAYAAASGRSAGSAPAQLDYLWAELTGEEPAGIEMSYAAVQWGYWGPYAQAFRNEHGYGAESSWEEFLSIKDVKTACRYFYAAIERGQPYEENQEGLDRAAKAQEYYAKMRRKGTRGGAQAGQAAVDEAYGLLGAPYVYGAAGPDSFDCSGLVVWCYSAQGYDFGGARITDQLWALCDEVSEDDLEVGDLVFMNRYCDGREWGHVGMYFGDGKVIHTATEGVGVVVEPLHGSWLDDNGLAFGRLP